MGLMYAQYPHPEPIERAVKLVMSRQLPVRSLRPWPVLGTHIRNLFPSKDGSWAQEAPEGMTNGAIPLLYPNYKFSFTIWMLGKADGYLKQLRAKNGANGFAKGHLISLGHNRFPLDLVCAAGASEGDHSQPVWGGRDKDGS